ncbi:restriction endonuclease subunit S [Polaribacter sejongensis]|uniref:restriction endonuclease subunit S n=1 Tax=Polaribacter sejongensis TaxID=985043 RepID=UPI0035A57288
MANKLPKNWVETEFKELASFVIGGDWGKDLEFEFDVESELVSCIRGSEIKNWERDKGSTSSIRKVKSSSLEKRALIEGDILIEISGGGPDQPVGRTVFIDKEALNVNSEYKKVCTNFLRMVRIYDNLDKKFIKNYLDSFYLSGEVLKYQGGSNNLRNLKFKEFETIKIPLPPLAEQQRIVAKLDVLFNHLDNLKTRLDHIPQLLKNFRQAVLTQAVTGKLTEEWRVGKELEDGNALLNNIKKLRTEILEDEISKGKPESKRLLRKIEKLEFEKPEDVLPITWIWTCFLESSLKVVDCHNKTAPYVNEGICLLRTTNIKEGKIKLKGSKFITQETYDFWSKRCPPKENDILFTREAPMGEAAIIPKGMKVCMGQRMMLVRTIPELLIPKYLLYNILSFSFQQRMISNAIGTSVKHLRVGDVERLTFPLPPKEEQTEIVKRVEVLFAKADNIETQYQSLKTKIDSLPQAILAKAFKGELVAQLDSDGSAAVLLEEIKKLKEELKPVKKTVKRKKK